jgi:DNA-damage-inducible protein J
MRKLSFQLHLLFQSCSYFFNRPTSTAINMFARVAVRDKKLPFEVSLRAEPLTGEAWLTEMRRRIKEIESGKTTLHELIEAQEDD